MVTGASAGGRAVDPEGRESLFRRLARGWFGKLVLPGVVLQSVLIGGGYATGREVVEYGSRYGAGGWVSVGVIFVGFTLVAAVTFEVARVFRAYDYKGFVRCLIGPLWPAFDLLFGAMAVLVIAVMASAATEIMGRTLGIPGPAGLLAVVAAVGVLTYRGARTIEAFKSVGTTLLYLAYLLFALLVITQRWDAVAQAFASPAASGGPAATGGAGTGTLLRAGVLYVGYNLVSFPAVLFTLRRQTRRRETLAAAVVAGLLMTVPFALSHLCFLAYHPAPEVLEAPVPWLPVLESVGGSWLVGVFGVVMGWTLLETSVGLIHALLDRVDADLREVGLEADGRRGPDDPEGDRPADDGGIRGAADDRGGDGRGLTRLQSGLLGMGILGAAALLSRVGIVALVAEGYTVMGYLFIGLFGLPLLTVGLARAWRASG